MFSSSHFSHFCNLPDPIIHDVMDLLLGPVLRFLLNPVGLRPLEITILPRSLVDIGCLVKSNSFILRGMVPLEVTILYSP